MRLFLKHILIAILSLVSLNSMSQCVTSINTVPSTLDTINCGASIPLQVNLPLSSIGDDFSTGGLGTIWQGSTINYQVASSVPNGCLPPVYCPLTGGLPANVSTCPTPNNMFWFTGGSAGWLTTIPIDINCLGTLTLDYRHETQSPAPCDGPDQPNEGQYLEYRTQGGVWQQINYWVPVTSGGPMYQHCWNTYTFNITPAMFSTGTQFRIGTLSTSAANWDQWGISNFSINLDPPCGTPYVSTISGPGVPPGYTLDTITVTPLTDSAVYIVDVTNGANSCSDTVVVYVEQPSIVASVIPSVCLGSDTLDAVATITSRCDYTLVLRNYKSNGNPLYPGWGTGQPPPNDFNYVDMYRNGSLIGYFTMGGGGQNATDTFPLPLVDGDLLETDFSGFGAGGPSGQECYYYIYDSQMNPVAATNFGPTPSRFWNIIDVNINNGGTGYNTTPWSPANPQPTCTLTGGGGTYATCDVNGVSWPTGDITSIVVTGAIGYSSPPTVTINGTNTTPASATAVLNAGTNPSVGPGILVSCPVTTTYTYAWTNISTTPPSTTGLNNPNIPNPISTVSVPTNYQVIATSNVNPQCVAIDTISVPGSAGNGDFDVSLISSPNICNDGTPINIVFEITSSTINAGNFTFDIIDGNGNLIAGGIAFDASTLPFTGVIPPGALPSPLTAGTYTFSIENIQDNVPCPVAANNGVFSITIVDPYNTGTPPFSTIEICSSTPITDTLFNSWSSTPYLNGTWTYIGTNPPGSNLPANNFNYSLDPSIFPIGLNVFEYQVPSVVGCPSPSASQVNVNITSAPSAGILTASAAPLCMNGPNIPLNLYDLFTAGNAPPNYSPSFWTDITNGTPGTVQNPNFSPGSAGNYTFRYTAPIQGNCPADWEDVNITVYDQPSAVISTDDANNQICDGDIINLVFNLTGSPDYTVDYVDNNGNVITANLNAAGNDATTNLPIQIFPSIGSNQYTITNVSDINGCSNTNQNNVNVTVVLPPNAGNATSNTICSDDFTTYSLNVFPFFPTGADINGSWTYQGAVPPTANPFGVFQAWDPVLQSPVDPFGTYRYTVTDISGTCPDAWQDIDIIEKIAPSTGEAKNQSICINDYSFTNQYSLSNLFDPLGIPADPGGDWKISIGGIWTTIPGGIGATIDPNDPTYGFTIGAPGNAFRYEIMTPVGDPCNNNNSLPYVTQSILTINPEPVVSSITANPTSVPQSSPSQITVTMSTGIAPFTVSLSGNESPPSSALFNITSGMSGSGPITPNYDIMQNPVDISVVSVQDGNDCWTANPIIPTISTPITVEPWPEVSLTSTPPPYCENGSVDLFIQGEKGAVPLTVQYTINNVPQPPVPVNNIGLPLTTVNLSSSPNWSPVGLNQIQVTSITDAAGYTCPPNSLPTVVYIDVNPEPVISSLRFVDANGNPVNTTVGICEGIDAILEFDFSVGTPPFNVNMTDQNGFGTAIPPFSGSTSQQYTINPGLNANTNPYTYTITNYQDANSCVGTIFPSASIKINPVPVISFNGFEDDLGNIITEICEYDTAYLTINIASSIIAPLYQVQIDNGSIIDLYSIDENGIVMVGAGAGGNIMVNPLTTTTYTIIDFLDPATQCGTHNSDNHELIVNENPNVSIITTPSPAEVCAGEKLYIDFIFTRGTGPWTIDFSIDGTNSILGPWNDTTTVTQVLTDTTYYSFEKITDFNSCEAILTEDFTVQVNPLPIAELTADNRFICDDGISKATLNFNINSGSAVNNVGKKYKVTYQVNLDQTTIPDSVFAGIHTIDTNITGDYTIIEVIDNNGCEAIDKGETVTIFVNPLPKADFIVYPQPTDINDPFITFVDNSKDHATSIWTGYSLLDTNGNYTVGSYWSDTLNAETTFVHEFAAVADTHYITLEVISDSGCTSIDSSFIIIDPGFTIFVPDAFTPDNDLYNDYFLPIVNGVQEYSLDIYNRLGNRIFSTNEYISQDCPRGCTRKKIEQAILNCIQGCDAAWDGKINGNYVPAGNFVYNIVVVDISGKIRNYNGSITLIR